MDFLTYVGDKELIVQRQIRASSTTARTITPSGVRVAIKVIEVYNRSTSIKVNVSVDNGSTFHDVLPESSIVLLVDDTVQIKSASATPTYEIQLGVKP